jgi:murein DD-endopeptidase MepM/ murein hydrolase activator NlpD
LHTGIDFGAKYGTPVFAVKAGVVKHAAVTGTFNSYGNLITIVHDDSSESRMSLYAHLSKMLVKPGQRVKAGQKIGEVGNTRGTKEDPGKTGATHLHFELLEAFPVAKDVGRIDPTSYLESAVAVVLPEIAGKQPGTPLRVGRWVLGLSAAGGLAWWLLRRRA